MTCVETWDIGLWDTSHWDVRCIEAGVGSIVLTGNTANLRWFRRFKAIVSSVTLAGNSIRVIQGRVITPGIGSVVLAGNSIGFKVNHVLITQGFTAGFKSFYLTGHSLRFPSGLKENVQPGPIHFGYPVRLGW